MFEGLIHNYFGFEYCLFELFDKFRGFSSSYSYNFTEIVLVTTVPEDDMDINPSPT